PARDRHGRAAGGLRARHHHARGGALHGRAPRSARRRRRRGRADRGARRRSRGAPRARQRRALAAGGAPARAPAVGGRRVVRYGLALAFVLVGAVLIAITGDRFGEAAGMTLIGCGVVVWFANVMIRLSESSNRDRDAEERARDYYTRHGRWPDEDRD